MVLTAYTLAVCLAAKGHTHHVEPEPLLYWTRPAPTVVLDVSQIEITDGPEGLPVDRREVRGLCVVRVAFFRSIVLSVEGEVER